MKLVLLFLMCLPMQSMATEDAAISEAVDSYYSQQMTFVDKLLQRFKISYETQQVRRNPDCEPDGRPRRPNIKECVDSACEKMGPFGCDSADELERVQRACRGNYGSACLNSTCTRLGPFGCDSMDEIERVSSSCRGVRSTECLDLSCNYLGPFGCDSIDEVERVGNSCQGWVDTDCIKSTCGRLGPFGCDSVDEVERVVLSCQGY